MWKWLKKIFERTTPTLQHDEIGDDTEEEMEEEMKIREPNEVADRILGLVAVIGKIHQGNEPVFINWINDHEIEQYLSHEEFDFFKQTAPDPQTKVDFSWRAEALTSLFWGIQVIDEMPPLNKEFNVYSLDTLSEIIEDPEKFKRNIRLRPHKELKEMEEHLYTQHWRVRDAQIRGMEMPPELNPSIVYERRYGMSWLTGWGEDWDNVPTDT